MPSVPDHAERRTVSGVVGWCHCRTIARRSQLLFYLCAIEVRPIRSHLQQYFCAAIEYSISEFMYCILKQRLNELRIKNRHDGCFKTRIPSPQVRFSMGTQWARRTPPYRRQWKKFIFFFSIFHPLLRLARSVRLEWLAANTAHKAYYCLLNLFNSCTHISLMWVYVVFWFYFSLNFDIQLRVAIARVQMSLWLILYT